MREEMKGEPREKHVYTVSELTRDIREIIEDSFPGVWVEGEISNFIQHTSGHIYFSLKDATSILRCAMFKRANEKLKFSLKNGMKVIVLGSVSLYEARGDYQLIIEEIEPRGVGALQLQFQQLKEKLQKEGLFDERYKTPIPFLPTRIGVVTSPTGAAIRDILSIARRRFANVEIIINPVKVQGVDAKEEIAAAIRQFNELGNIDVMIVGRGGGSLEDLWPFNEEVVARAIFDSEIPVISAVGHEIDFTIADFVADFRASTPSAAAELVIPKKEDLKRMVDTATAHLNHLLSSLICTCKERLLSLQSAHVLRRPLNFIVQREQRIDDLRKEMSVRIGHILEMSVQRHNGIEAKLEAFNPTRILERGYSITLKLPGGEVIKDVSVISRGDRVETRLGKGKFWS
ncbi:MAG: exodeoxyribonuclease VII large subunit, partial [bacterium]